MNRITAILVLAAVYLMDAYGLNLRDKEERDLFTHATIQFLVLSAMIVAIE